MISGYNSHVRQLVYSQATVYLCRILSDFEAFKTIPDFCSRPIISNQKIQAFQSYLKACNISDAVFNNNIVNRMNTTNFDWNSWFSSNYLSNDQVCECIITYYNTIYSN